MEIVKLISPALLLPEALKGSLETNESLISVYHKGLLVKDRTPEQLVQMSWSLLAKISIITGWQLPQDQISQDVLIDQFSKKLFESYPSVSEEEIEYAFRNFDIENWGQYINLSLIDKVLHPYLTKRSFISKLDEQEKKEQVLVDVSDEEFLESNRKLFLLMRNTGFISVGCYYILQDRGLLTKKSETPEEQRKIVAAYFGK